MAESRPFSRDAWWRQCSRGCRARGSQKATLVRLCWDGWTRLFLKAMLVGTFRTDLRVNWAGGSWWQSQAPLRNAWKPRPFFVTYASSTCC